jgi:hypothetical protein
MPPPTTITAPTGTCAADALSAMGLVILPNYGLRDIPKFTRRRKPSKTDYEHEHEHEREKQGRIREAEASTLPFVRVLVIVLVIGFSGFTTLPFFP